MSIKPPYKGCSKLWPCMPIPKYMPKTMPCKFNGVLPIKYVWTAVSRIVHRMPMVIMITAHGDIDMAVDAMRNGAHDFIQKPIEDMTRLESSIKRAGEIIRLKREVNHIRQTQSQAEGFVIGNSQKMKTIVEQAKKAAEAVGEAIAKQALGVGIKCVCFDRNRYKFHGRTKVLADAARKAGLVF